MLNGTFRDHMAVEQALREFYGMSGAIVFSTGYMANLGMISTLVGKGEYVILDADSHASIYDGCKQGVAEIVRFRHNSVEDLDKRLGRLPKDAGKLVVLEGVYSMLGDVAPLKEMVAVAKKHGAMVLSDEAQADEAAPVLTEEGDAGEFVADQPVGHPGDVAFVGVVGARGRLVRAAEAQPVVSDHFTPGDPRQKIRIRDILNMSSGLRIIAGALKGRAPVVLPGPVP